MAATAIWPGDPQTALTLIEDSLALTRAGASDVTLGMALTWTGVIRAQNGDLAGALAALQEVIAQRHAEGNRLLLGMTLQIAAAVLARLGEAEPAAVLAGAFSAHFPPDISAVHEDERLGIGEARSLARRALGEAAYAAALARGAAMDDDQIVEYAQGEYLRLASLPADPVRRHRNHHRALRGRAAGNDRAPGKTTCRSTAGAVRHHDHFQPADGRRPSTRRRGSRDVACSG